MSSGRPQGAVALEALERAGRRNDSITGAQALRGRAPASGRCPPTAGSVCRQATSSRPAAAATSRRARAPARSRRGETQRPSQPSPSLRRALQRGIGAAADQDRRRRDDGGADRGPLDREEASAERHLGAGEERAHERQRLVRARAAGARVDAAQAQLGGIVAADADAELEPPGRDAGDRRELAGHRRRVPQGEQIDAGLDMDVRVRGEQRRSPGSGRRRRCRSRRRRGRRP